MQTVREISRLTGVSVRTLHHYDAIGLLKPAAVTDAGYRLYDAACLERLQRILFFRELEFPLHEIRTLLDAPNFDPAAALEDQIRLLELRRKRLEALIGLARTIQKQGVETMDFAAFDRREIETYEAEVKARWGKTEAYKEYAKRGEKTVLAEDALMAVFAKFGTLRGLAPDAKPVQEMVRALQEHITAHFYTCTPEILFGLGQMYVQDERFRRNIDEAGGEGTAELVCSAIKVYCQK